MSRTIGPAVGTVGGPAAACDDRAVPVDHHRPTAPLPSPAGAPGAAPPVGPPPDGTGRPGAGRSWPAELLRAPVAWRTWRSVVYLLAAAPLGSAAFAALAAAGLACLLAMPLALVGVVLLGVVLHAVREYGAVSRALAAAVLGERVPAPRRRQPADRGLLPWLRAALGDLDGWRAVAFVVVSTPVRVVGLGAVALAAGTAVALVASPVAWLVLDPTQVDADGTVHRSIVQFGDVYVDTWPEAMTVAALGALGLFAAPWLARAAAAVDVALVRALLGPTRLVARVESLEETRALAVDDTAATLRRIERDLHDGAQARLVALAMHLDMAREELVGDAVDAERVGRARTLVERAHRDATEAITELREVTRSIHPPALDRGLDEALATLTSRSAVPCRLTTDLPVRPSPAVETIAYHCVAELLTNVAKHSGASRATVAVAVDGGVLHLRVTDDGAGGARLVPGHGLAGLADRVRTVDGWLTLSSPAGGPTEVTIGLPVRA